MCAMNGLSNTTTRRGLLAKIEAIRDDNFTVPENVANVVAPSAEYLERCKL